MFTLKYSRAYTDYQSQHHNLDGAVYTALGMLDEGEGFPASIEDSDGTEIWNYESVPLGELYDSLKALLQEDWK